MSDQPAPGPQSSRRERVKRGAIGAGAAVGAVGSAVGAPMLFAPPADAATFSVTNTDDAGPGSLRQAVEDADAAAGADIITFAPAVTGAITLTSGEITIDDAALEIQGPGAAILAVDGGDASRIFSIPGNDDTLTTVISGLTLRNGSASGNGGAILMDNSSGGIVTLRDSVISGNDATSDGGAVYTGDGTVNAYDTIFTGNTAGDDGGAVFLDANDAVQTWRNVTISGNTAADDGGGIMFYTLYNQTVVENSTISGNSAGGTGGGAYFYTAYDENVASGTAGIIVSGTTISGNTAVDGGGGVYFSQETDQWERAVRIENTTISGNSSTTGPGGGVFLPNLDLVTNPEGTITFDSSTIANNQAPAAGGMYRPHEVTLANTIVADNTNGDLVDAPAATGTFSLAFSLIETPGAAATTDAVPGSNLTGVDPKLGALADNGGPTKTQLPLTGSPALDAGSTALTKDQRDLARPFDLVSVADSAATGADASDIGAVEVVITATCAGRTATIIATPGVVTNGTPGADVIVGTAGADTIKGLDGDDVICGKGGNDKLLGGDGKDIIRDQAGNDKTIGGAGNDRLVGGSGNDVMTGGAGKDKIGGWVGDDLLKGNAGNDKLLGGKGDDTLKGGPGKDVMSGGPGSNTIIQRRDEDVVE